VNSYITQVLIKLVVKLGGIFMLAATAVISGLVIISQGIPILHPQAGVIPIINDINQAGLQNFALNLPVFILRFPKVAQSRLAVIKIAGGLSIGDLLPKALKNGSFR
jgi:hypothetical protein